MFSRYVDGCREEWRLACYAGDVWYTAWFLLGEEVRDGELSDADGVCEVDVEEGVARGGGVVSRGWATGRMPEI